MAQEHSWEPSSSIQQVWHRIDLSVSNGHGPWRPFACPQWPHGASRAYLRWTI